ncbi:hypothetical protein B0H10DRAFT_2052094 [Mycena sp. CBHHK59/15]|nr:hypothetical protein B0H10DRAFT_2052094 [Mycena sp. CBHHK59/15]
MIITPPDLKDIHQEDVVVKRAAVSDDPPPAYFSPPVSEASTPAPPLTAPTAPDTIKPTNFLSLSRGNGSLKGTYVIDPRIKIPQPMLPPLASDETESTRRNVFMHTSNGSIDVDIFVVGDGDFKRKVDMLVKSSNGSITTRVHAPDAARPPINLKVQDSNGRHGSVKFSAGLSTDLTTFSEANQTHRCFVGDFSDWTDESDGWMGDEINVESSNGGVKLQYDVEPGVRDAESKGKGKGTFLGRFLGF